MSDSTPKMPQCQMCKDDLTEGLKLKRQDDTALFLCYRCFDLIQGVIEDSLEEWTAAEVKNVE